MWLFQIRVLNPGQAFRLGGANKVWVFNKDMSWLGFYIPVFRRFELSVEGSVSPFRFQGRSQSESDGARCRSGCETVPVYLIFGPAGAYPATH